MDHQQRHQYLEAIGISSWLPVEPLAAAAPSDDWVWDFRYPAPEIPFDQPNTVSGSTGSAESQACSTVDVSQARAALSEVLNSVAGKQDIKPAIKQAAAEPVQAQPKAAVEEIPRFCLAFIPLGSWLLIDSAPTAANGEYSPELKRLLANISVYLAPKVEGSPSIHLVKWPMLASKSVDQSRSQAIAAVSHKLKTLVQRFSCNKVALLGAAAADICLDMPEVQVDAIRETSLAALYPDTQTVVSHSLGEALKLPELKAELWIDLQKLLDN